MTPNYDPATFPHRDLTEKIIGAFHDVHNELGLQVESEVKLFVHFRGHVGEFDADVFVERKVILEL